MNIAIPQIIQYRTDRNHPEPRSQIASIFPLILTQFPTPVFKEIQKYGVVEIFEVLTAEGDALGGQGMSNRMVNQA